MRASSENKSGPKQRRSRLESGFNPGSKLEVAMNPASFISEQFRALKVALLHTSREPLRVIHVTSASTMDGKSLVSANLAYCLAAEAGKKVVLVDLDLRSPAVATHFNLPDSPGVVEYLADPSLQLEQLIRQVGPLHVLTAGQSLENPVELLLGERLQSMLETLRNRFDTIILDSPPLQPITDGRILSNYADGILLVVRRGKTPFDGLQKAIRLLDRKRIVGAVFNDVSPTMFNTYYDYRLYSREGGKAYPYGKKN